MVAEVIRRLVRAGKSVLVASYTHSAVDTILEKIVEGWEREEEFGTHSRRGTRALATWCKMRERRSWCARLRELW